MGVKTLPPALGLAFISAILRFPIVLQPLPITLTGCPSLSPHPFTFLRGKTETENRRQRCSGPVLEVAVALGQERVKNHSSSVAAP